MKRTVILLLTVLVLAFLFPSCAQAPDATAPTGYPSDEVQFQAVYYHGNLYRYDANGFDQPLPEGFLLVGKIQEIQNKELPSTELRAAHLDVGQQVYANTDDHSQIYVAFDSGYARFQMKS